MQANRDHADWSMAVVSPVYNERENIRAFVDEVIGVLDTLEGLARYEIILVNDGSTDGSDETLDACAKERPGRVRVLHLARNFGMEAAIDAGLACAGAGADAVVIMDSDMQDDPAIFPEFVAKWRAGYDVVYAVRSSREESIFRCALFWAFYRMLGWIADVPIPLDAGNFALMDKRVARALGAMRENNRFLRGLRAWVGFRQIGVAVARRGRYDHATRMGFRGQWKLAMNAIFSFSYVPLFVFRIAGAFTLLVSAALILWTLYHKLVIGIEMKAWASQMIAISFIGGINLLGIGVIGEYVARIYDEVKGRPNYVVHRETQYDDQE